MSTRKPKQPTVYVYAPNFEIEGLVSYYSRKNRIVTAGSLDCSDIQENPIQEEILVKALQTHIDAGYNISFDINPINETSSPINSRVRTCLESKLKFPEKQRR